MSDIYGRRPILLVGACGALLSTIMFGFSFNYPFAIFARFLNGLLNGNIGVAKTYLGEITDSTNQFRAFGLIGLTWGAGSIAGALAGGFFSRITEKTNFFDNNGIFGKFPYLLPNLLSAILQFCGLIGAYLYLTENTIFLEYKDKLQQDIELEKIHENSQQSVPNETGQEYNETTDKDKMLISVKETPEQIKRNRSAVFKLVHQISLFIHLKDNKEMPIKNPTQLPLVTPRTAKRVSIFKEKLAMKSCTLYALIGFTFTMLDELYPLWVILDQAQGGLGFTTDQMGITNSIGGVAVVTIQLFVYKRIAKKLGLIKTFRLGIFIIIPLFLLLPTVNLVTPGVSGLPSWVFWTYLISIWILRQFSGQLSFSAVMNMITNSVDCSNMGAANGLGQSLVALLRGIGPVLAGFLFSWSTTNGLPFPMNIYFMFFIEAVLSIGILIFTLGLPLKINKPKAESEGLISPEYKL